MIYEFWCANCAQSVEEDMPMTEATSTTQCPICHGTAFRVFFPPIVKGDTVVKEQ
jgi:putative FmdB family regulatory protein